MTHKPSSDQGQSARYFSVAVAAVIALCMIRVISRDLGADAVFGPADNDDIMRMLSVRSWLAGQSWFDMTQYGVLPPDGVSLHWTRYIDLGIGALIWCLGLFLGPAQAELWAAIVWPTCLLVGFIAATAIGTRRLISPLAAIIAVFVVLAWAPISIGYFKPGRVDHHNVQIILLSVATLSVLWPGAPLRSGTLAGLAVALSVTTGLETVFYLAGLGTILLVRSAWDHEGARLKLTAFSIATATAATLAHLGQTAPAAWFELACDKLSPIYLLVIWIGAVSAVSFWVLPQTRRTPWIILALTGVVAGVGLAVSLPLLGNCLSDPYSHLPQEVQAFIATDVIEALPLAKFAARFPGGALDLFQLAFASLLLAAIILLITPRRDSIAHPGTIISLLFLALIGCLASLLQVRQIVLLAPVVPLLAGFALAQIYAFRQRQQSSKANLGLALVLVLFVLPMAAGDHVLKLLQPGVTVAAKVQSEDANCALPSVLAKLDQAPAGRVLSPINLGPKLTAFSHHNALSAPYHRSADALENGFVPFWIAGPELLAWAQRVSADYLLLCAGAEYGKSAGTELASGVAVPGFTPLGIDAAPLLLFAVEGPSQ